ncbi:MAG: hypothetical protein U0237_19590 [Thermoleophilia bacterium]
MATILHLPVVTPGELARRDARLGGELGALALLLMRSGAVSPPMLAEHGDTDSVTARSTLHRLAVSGLARAAVLDGLTWFAITPEGDALVDGR